jgi:hypothetical protein
MNRLTREILRVKGKLLNRAYFSLHYPATIY